MTDQKSNGRTPWDLLSDLLTNRWLLVLVALALVLVATIVHLNAKPGSEVVLFWGLAKYQKPEQFTQEKPPTPQEATADDIRGYFLPENVPTHSLKSPVPGQIKSIYEPVQIPILDKGIFVVANVFTITIGGPNVSLLSIAGRSEDGNPLFIKKTETGALEMRQAKAPHLEMMYKGNLFVLSITQSGAGFGALTVKNTSKPTLTLKGYSAL
jgi:hypothetical protein